MRVKVRVIAMAIGGCAVLASCSTGGVSDLTPTSATVHGTVLTLDKPGSYVFQYATSAAALGTDAGKVTPRRQLAAKTAQKEIGEAVTGLAPETTYTYRLCGRQEDWGSDVCVPAKRFRTPPPGSTSVTFSEPGKHTFTVPAGVTEITGLVVGASGGSSRSIQPSPATSESFAVPGGKGGSIQRRLPEPVVPGDVVTILVGARGGDSKSQDGSVFAGGRGGRNGTEGESAGAGGAGGNGSVEGTFDGLLPTIEPAVGGAGGGAASSIRQVIRPFGASANTLTAGGGGGAGGGGSSVNGGPAAGGDGGPRPTAGVDGFRSSSRAPFSLGGLPGQQTSGNEGNGGLGGGGDSDGSDGGTGGTIAAPAPTGRCQVRYRQGGGGGGGGGWYGGGGGGAGRYDIIGIDAPSTPCGFYPFSVGYDGASGGAGGRNRWDSYSPDPGTDAPIENTGVNEGDGYVTLIWKVPAGS